MSFQSLNTNKNETILSVVRDHREPWMLLLHRSSVALLLIWRRETESEVICSQQFTDILHNQCSQQNAVAKRLRPKLLSNTLVKLSATETPSNTEQTPVGCPFTWPCPQNSHSKPWLAWGSFPHLQNVLVETKVVLRRLSEPSTTLTVQYEAITTCVIV